MTNTPPLARRLLAELLGSAFLAAVVIGSGIAAQRLSPGDVGLELHVCPDKLDFSSQLTQFSREILARLASSTGDDETGTLFGKSHRRLATDAGKGSSGCPI